MRTVFLTPIPPLAFKPYCVSYEPIFPFLSSRIIPTPINPPDYILGVGQGYILLLVDLPSPEPDKSFMDFCERLAIGHGADFNSQNVRH
jgi:hypothetical protein